MESISSCENSDNLYDLFMEFNEIKSNVVIEGYTTIGDNNKIFPFAVIGEEPQDLKYSGEKSKIKIGNNNRIREHCTIHTGTKGDKMITKIGNNNLLMVNTHIAHDCVIGNNCILANNVTLGGHVHVGNYSVIGGLSAIHQKVHIGKHSMIGGMTPVEFDVIPYGVVVAKRTTSLEGIELYPNESYEVEHSEDTGKYSTVGTYLVLSKTLSAEDMQAEDALSYRNYVEIISTASDTGRRDFNSAEGNFEGVLDEQNPENDIDAAERVIILPPFGENKIIIGIIIAAIVILGVGVIFIKKKVV